MKGRKMGKPDESTKVYMSDKNVFADVFNFFLYGGNDVIRAEDLETEDISSVINIFKSAGTDSEFVSRYRDILNSAVINRNAKATFVLLGIENQTAIHYAMPVRNMLYDVLQYVKQVNEYTKYHRKTKDTKTKDEFLSGITKDDKIIPVITLVVYFGKDEWDGACKLSDMFVDTDDEILKYVQDYEIMLINPKQIADADFGKFSTDLGKVLKLLKYADDMKQTSALLHNPNDNWTLCREAIDVLKNCINIRINNEMNEEDGEIMRDAWDDWREDGKREGIVQIILNMYKKHFSIEQIVTATNYSEEQIREIIGKSEVNK